MELIRQVASLRVLAVVARTGSFSLAASELGISQSAVSQHVASLERHVGLPLVQRGTRPLDLMPAGAILAEHGAAVDARLSGAAAELAELAGRRHRRLRLGGFPTSLATFVPKALSLLRRRMPDVSLVVVDDHAHGLVPRLLRRELDVAVVFDDPRDPAMSAHAGELELVPLMDDPYRLLVPRSHRLASAVRRPTLRDLAGEPWVGGSPRSTWFQIVRNACVDAGFDPDVSLTSDDHLAVQAFVAAGLGIAVVPGLVASRPIAGVHARELRGDVPTRGIVAARPASPFPPAAATTMITLLQQVTRPRG